MKNNYLWYTDLHLNRLFPWTLYSFIKNIVTENPTGVFLTGDISNGTFTCFHLKLMATFIKCPIYFILGNHDYYLSDIETQHAKIRKMCKNYPNLIWLTDSDVIKLDDDIALIGVEGWYDAKVGNPKYLKYAADWFMIKDFRKLLSMKERVESFRHLANNGSELLTTKLTKALSQNYKSIYILTHFPPWKEATRYRGSYLEKYFMPYNINLGLGKMIEKIMSQHREKNVTVCCGHTHQPEFIRVSNNINCQVGAANQLETPHSQIIYL
jgi:Icc protein